MKDALAGVLSKKTENVAKPENVSSVQKQNEVKEEKKPEQKNHTHFEKHSEVKPKEEKLSSKTVEVPEDVLRKLLQEDK